MKVYVLLTTWPAGHTTLGMFAYENIKQLEQYKAKVERDPDFDDIIFEIVELEVIENENQ